jgi:hypothetical protein
MLRVTLRETKRWDPEKSPFMVTEREQSHFLGLFRELPHKKFEAMKLAFFSFFSYPCSPLRQWKAIQKACMTAKSSRYQSFVMLICQFVRYRNNSHKCTYLQVEKVKDEVFVGTSDEREGLDEGKIAARGLVRASDFI